jgi:fibronectin type 3 domain-containing protein
MLDKSNQMRKVCDYIRSYQAKGGIVLLLLAVLFSLQPIQAQEKNKAKLYLKTVQDTIKLRWIVTDFQLWEASIVQGYDIYRKEMETGEIIKLNDTIVRALKPDEWGMRNMVFNDSIGLPDPNTDTLSVMALGYQFPEEVGLTFDMPDGSDGVDFGQDSREMMHMFHSVATLYSKEAAYVSGYTFSDTNFFDNTTYEYFLCRAGDFWDKSIASAMVNACDPYPDLTPQIVSDKTNKGECYLFWQKSDTLDATVGSYEIYRSENKENGYVSMANPPLLALLDPYNFKDEPVIFKDATLEKEKVYYYKVRAIDVFGDYSDFSEPYKVIEKTLLSSVPRIVQTETSERFMNTIEWDIKLHDISNINHMYVCRNSKATGVFKPISKRLSTMARKYIDVSPINTNYYKIMAVGNANDTVWSAAKFVNIPDSIPPSTPKIVSAVCDSLGIVRLKWKHGGEEDLKQFNIYTANFENEEYSRIANIGVDSVYTDTISLGVLGKSVFYKVVAFDNSYNPSDFSEAFEVLRYDTIPPNPPIITDIRSSEDGIHLKWACSSSPDVKHSVLQRKLRADTTWQQIRLFGVTGKSYESYIDTTVVKGEKYQYTLTAYDEFGLSSKGGRVMNIQAYDNGERGSIRNFKAVLNKQKHTVKLKWEYNKNGVERFIVYRTLNGSSKAIVAGVNGNVYEYYDERTGPGNTYGYCIKALYFDGSESPLTKEIIVNF